jgi:hydrogenase maturation protease
MEKSQHSQRIVGIGSPHGNDCVGWLVADRLRRREGLSQCVYSLSTPIEMLDHLAGCEILVIVDACQSGKPVGSIVRLQWPDSRIVQHHSVSSHGWGVGQTLQLAEQLDRLPPLVVVYGLEVGKEGRVESAVNKVPGIDAIEQCVLDEISKSQFEKSRARM